MSKKCATNGSAIFNRQECGIDLLNNRLPVRAVDWLEQAIGGKQCLVSTINRIELLSVSPLISQEGWQELRAFVHKLPELTIDEDVVLETIRIRQTHRRKLPDALIAATALVHSLTVVTRDAPVSALSQV